jgi:hypothetical protein
MKKTIILTVFLLTGVLFVSALPVRVHLNVFNDDPTIGIGGIHKSPVQVPVVNLDDHTLYFTTSCVGDTLQLVQNGVVVYSTVIASDEVELPATLEGDYELQIIHNEWLFYGDIEL